MPQISTDGRRLFCGWRYASPPPKSARRAAAARRPPEPLSDCMVDGNDVAHALEGQLPRDSNSLRFHRSTRASTSTMSHQLAASRGLPQTAPGLAMQAPVASQSYDSPGAGRTARVAAPS